MFIFENIFLFGIVLGTWQKVPFLASSQNRTSYCFIPLLTTLIFTQRLLRPKMSSSRVFVVFLMTAQKLWAQLVKVIHIYTPRT